MYKQVGWSFCLGTGSVPTGALHPVSGKVRKMLTIWRESSEGEQECGLGIVTCEERCKEVVCLVHSRQGSEGELRWLCKKINNNCKENSNEFRFKKL